MEIALSLVLDPADIIALRRHPLLQRHADATPQKRQFTHTYFDTADLYFRRHDAALCVSRFGRAWVQSVQRSEAHAGLQRRRVWESRATGPWPDLAALRSLHGKRRKLRVLLSEPVLPDKLLPIFTARIRRTVWQLHLPHGMHIELALDQGTLTCDDRHEAINELCLVLKAGDAQCLFDCALALLADLPLRIGSCQAERGYTLYAPQPPQVVKAAALELSPHWSVERGLQAIVGNCMQQIEGNTSGVVQGSDPESVHQMRVGLRRLRSALRLFEQIVVPISLQEELDWLGGELGPARDWDVLGGASLASLTGDDAPPMQQLQQCVLKQAARYRRRAAAAVSSTRYARLLLALRAWSTGAGWRAGLGAAERHAWSAPLGPGAEQILTRSRRKLLKRGEGLHEGDVRMRHRARIAAKRVRYAAEFFQSLYQPKRVNRFIRALTALQDALGRLNDASVASRLLLPLSRRAGLAQSVDFAIASLSAEARPDIRKLDKLWREFAGMKAPKLRR